MGLKTTCWIGLKVGLVLAAGAACAGPTAEIAAPAQVPTQEAVAKTWTQRLLAPGYRPPEGSRYVLLPSSGDESCDLMRMQYQVAGQRVILTQTSSTFALQIQLGQTGKPSVTPTSEVQSRARRVFAGGGSLVLSKAYQFPDIVAGVSDPVSVPRAKWLSQVFWASRPGQISFYTIKSTHAAADNRTFDRFWNRRWFSPDSGQKKFKVDPVLEEILVPVGTGNAAPAMAAAGLAARLLKVPARPPGSLSFQRVSEAGRGAGDLARIRYQRGEYLLTLSILGNDFGMLAERLKAPSERWVAGSDGELVLEAKNEITPAQVEAFVRQTLVAGEALTVVTERPPANGEASGSFRAAEGGVLPAVGRDLRWWTRRGALILRGTLPSD